MQDQLAFTKEKQKKQKVKPTVAFFVDAGTKNNGKVGSQFTVIACFSIRPYSTELKKIFDIKVGDKTNNEGELLAILEILKILHQKNYKKNIVIFSDSQLAVNLVNSQMNTSIDRLVSILLEIKKLKEEQHVVKWIPREANYSGYYIESIYNL